MNKASAAAFVVVLSFILLAGYIVFTNVQSDLRSPKIITPREETTPHPIAEVIPPHTETWQPGEPVIATATPEPQLAMPTMEQHPTIAIQTPTATATLEPTPTQTWLGTPTQVAGERGNETFPSPTPTLAGKYSYYLDGGVLHDLEAPCTGQYIKGTIRDKSQTPLEGIRIRAYDLWGNQVEVLSKGGPDAGKWDIVLGSTPNVWHVVVLDDAGNEISPVALVPHHQEGEFKDACTHVVNWRRAW